MSTFKNKSCLRTIEAQIVQKLKNNKARPKFTGSYKNKSVYRDSRHSNWAIPINCFVSDRPTDTLFSKYHLKKT